MDKEHRELLDKIEKLRSTGKGKQLDEHGREVLDPRPMDPPVGYVKQPTMVEHIRALVRSELLRQEAESQDIDTFDEADDFDVEDDLDDPRTPYEAVFDPPATPLPGELSEPPVRPPEAPETAPQAQGTQPQAGEMGASSAGPTPATGSQTPPNPPRPPNTPRKA